jgi:CRP-like cAMP-binding protein
MPRTSPYQIILEDEEKEKLQWMARNYTLPYRDVVRARIVLYAAQGMENKEIAERLDTRREIVSKWRKRFFKEGLLGLEEKPRGGRPNVFSPSGGGGGESPGL